MCNFFFPLQGSEMHNTDLRSYTISAGLAFKLECSEMQNMTWRRVPDQRLESISGINIRGNALWFLPANLSHSGSYSCLSRYDAVHKVVSFWHICFEYRRTCFITNLVQASLFCPAKVHLECWKCSFGHSKWNVIIWTQQMQT